MITLPTSLQLDSPPILSSPSQRRLGTSASTLTNNTDLQAPVGRAIEIVNVKPATVADIRRAFEPFGVYVSSLSATYWPIFMFEIKR